MSARTREHLPPIDRASPTDRAFLAMDSGQVPEQFGVVLLLDAADGFSLSRGRRLIAERVHAAPRLRQRLIRSPFGCGGPVWVDDESFDVSRHVRELQCADPGDERALLDTVVSVIASPLPRTAPLWSATFITGLADGNVALVLVLHHVLADGLGGLTILAGLVDQGAGAAHVFVAHPRPPASRLAREAWSRRMRAMRHLWQAGRLLRTSMAAGGGLRPPRATPCSLLQRTGPHRRLAVVRADAAALRAAAHRHGASTNDAVLVAVAGALHHVLLDRGEWVDTVAVAVPVSGHRGGEPAQGNMVSPLLVQVPGAGGVHQRLQTVATAVHPRRPGATGPPPIALLGWLFRPLAALGGFRWYMNHQHRLHTLVSHVRGPTEPVTFGGSPIIAAIPVALADNGNVTVYFEALSYAGTITITVIADPDRFPDLDTLTGALRAELNLIIDATE